MAFLDVLRIILAVINIIANLIGFVFGGVLFGIGIAGIVFFNFFSDESRDAVLFLNAGFGVILAVGLIFLIFSIFAIIGSYLACCPANKAVRCLAIFLLTFDLIALTILFILEVVGVILAFVYRDQITGNFVPLLSNGFNASYSTSPNGTQDLVENIQLIFGCCGINGASDFGNYPGYPDGNILPRGCCNSTVTVCTLATRNADIGGCGVLIRDYLIVYYNVVGGVGVFNVIVILLLIIVELLLIFTIFKSGSEDNMKAV